MLAYASQLDTLILNGHCIYYRKHGKESLKSSEGNYFNDKKDGIWTFYDSLGRIYLVKEYLLGRIIKPFEWHDTLGNITTESGWDRNTIYLLLLKDFILNYPIEINNPNNDTVVVAGVIDSTGRASKIKILRSKNKSLNKPALDFVKSLPNFVPATKNKIPIEVPFDLYVVLISRKDLL